MLLADKDIGGAHVTRAFTNRGRFFKKGDHLTAEDVLSMPMANRRALADASYISIYPKSTAGRPAEKFIVSVGKDRHDVIAGHRLNEQPLSREDAQRLAHED